MNTRLNVFVMTSATLLLSLAWNSSTLAQESEREMPDPQVDRVSCEDVDWHQNMLRDYPWVVGACHEAIIVDGQRWARFEAEFQDHHSDGAITSTFKNDRGRSIGSVRLMPGEDQRVMLDDRATRFSDLSRGQVLNFYVPEGMYAFTTEPGAPEAEQVQVVEPSAAEPEERQLAQADPATTRRPDTLPATAGPLPIIALGGLLSLLGGATLTMRRRLKTPNA